MRDPIPSAVRDLSFECTLAWLKASHIGIPPLLNTGPNAEDLDFNLLEQCTTVCMVPSFLRPGTVIYDQAKFVSSKVNLVSPVCFNKRAEIKMESNTRALPIHIFLYHRQPLPMLSHEDSGPTFLYLTNGPDGKPYFPIPKELTKYADVLVRGDPSKMTLKEWCDAISTTRMMVTDDPVLATMFVGYSNNDDCRLISRGWYSFTWCACTNVLSNGWIGRLIDTADHIKKGEHEPKPISSNPVFKVKYWSTPTYSLSANSAGGTGISVGSATSTSYYWYS